MPYSGPLGFARVTSFVMNVFIGIVLGMVLLFLTEDIPSMAAVDVARSFFQSLVMSVLVGYALGDIVPTMTLAQGVADALKTKGLAHHAVVSVMLGLLNISLILCFCMFIMLVKDAGLMGVGSAVVSLWVPAVCAGIPAIFVFLPVAQAVASRVSKFDPKVTTVQAS